MAKEIIFNLKLKKNNNNFNNSNDLIQTLYNIVTSLSQKVEQQQKEIDSLKKRINILENQNNQSQNKSSQITKEEKLSKSNQNIYNNNNISNTQQNIYRFSPKECSYILRNKEEELSIKNWIHAHKQIKFNILYRMTRDGANKMNFHINCDNKGKTLVLIETKEGKRFGGYTSLQWNMDGEKKYGENIWLFTLEDTIYKYPLIQQNKLGAIICDMNNGPSFEDGILFNDNDLSTGIIEKQGVIKGTGIINKKFKVKQLEVFQVNIRY